MKLGITLLDDRVLLAFHYGDVREPEFRSYPLKEKGDSPGWVWRSADYEAFESFKRAESSILALPSALTFLKRLEVDGKLSKEQPDYLKWLASTQLPGDLSNFRYDFIPLRESYDSRFVQMLFYAAPTKTVERMLEGLKTDFEAMPTNVLPEQVGLVKVVEKSMRNDDIAQAGIVNCEFNGATAVYIQDGRFNHGRYFPHHSDCNEDLSTDIETYFLSRADATESLPLIVTGFTGDFKTNWSPIVPAFMGIHDLEFAGAWGVADFLKRRMKIVSGEFGGRIIKVPKIPHIRPSTEKTRQAIFSSLGADILDTNIADLFCGSGALGLEALSRGANNAIFVDVHRSAIATVKQNIQLLGLESRAKVMIMNVLSLRPLHLEQIEIIFADPPYRMGYADRLVALLSLQKFAWHGILVLEHEPNWHYDGEKFELVKRLEFGDTQVSFLLGRKE